MTKRVFDKRKKDFERLANLLTGQKIRTVCANYMFRGCVIVLDNGAWIRLRTNDVIALSVQSGGVRDLVGKED